VIKIIVGFVAVFVLVFMFRIESKLDTIEAKVEDLNRIVKTSETVSYTEKDVECLTKNIYYEAGIEAPVGQYAVGQITLNRLKTGYWGKSICDVVYAKDQFSWTRLKKLPAPDKLKWDDALMVAYDVLHGHRVASLDKSLFYHADYIKAPNWADPAYQITQIGRHIFYTKAKQSWLEL
jgi:spore germination cell wall hydrolase CwlJ-like protein